MISRICKSLIILYTFVCISVSVLWASAADQQSLPRVIGMGLVSPDILSVAIDDGDILFGKRVPYKAMPGDTIKEDNFPQRWLMRNGRLVGAIGGKKKDILLPFDRVLKAKLEASALQDVQGYKLASADDPVYKTPVFPQSVHRKTRPRNIGRTEPWKFEAAYTHVLYLKLPHPIREGKTYTLSFPGLHLQPYHLVMSSSRLVSEAIHVSQIGFRPDDPAKVAFLSCWTGDGGGIRYQAGTPFYIINAGSHKRIYKGEWQLSRAADDLTEDMYKRNYNGTDVYIADFTSLKQPGRYIIVLPGVGCSLPFTIGSDVWRSPFRTSARGLYHQRSGIALGPPYTSFVRPRDFHPDDGLKVYASTAKIIDTGNGPIGYDVEPTNFANLVHGHTDEIVPNAWGGYHDAGDWDRRIQHLVATRNLLDLVDMYPTFTAKMDLNIPMSDGLPDMLTEALFGLDVYRRLQTKEGGVRGGIESEEHPRYGETSWRESLTVMAYAPDAWSSYWYAGTAARAARVLGRYDPRLAREYRESALRAMKWADAQKEVAANPMPIIPRLLLRIAFSCGIAVLSVGILLRKAPRMHGSRRKLLKTICVLAIPLSLWRCVTAVADPGYPVDLHKSHLVRDARNYAAAELFRLTGDERWNDIFKSTTLLNKPDAVLMQWGSHDQSEAAWVYARTYSGDQELRRLCKEAILRTADERLSTCKTTGFRWTKYPWRPFGIGIPAAPDAATLIWAHTLTKDEKYLQGIVLTSQFGAGANPMNMCLTTGVGHVYPQHPLHLDSRLTGQPAPEGITVLGPMDVKSELFKGDWGRKLISPYCYPALENWPSAESYMDVFWDALLCEFTTHDSIAPNLYAWGYLSAR